MNRRNFLFGLGAAILLTTARVTGLANTSILMPLQRVFDMQIFPVKAGFVNGPYSLVVIGTGPERPSSGDAETAKKAFYAESKNRWTHQLKVFGQIDKDALFTDAARLYDLTA